MGILRIFALKLPIFLMVKIGAMLCGQGAYATERKNLEYLFHSF